MLAASRPMVRAAPESFQSFLARLRADAQRAGISSATLTRALANLQPNQQVLERYNHQPECTLTWAQDRTRLITDQRIANGRVAYQQNCSLSSGAGRLAVEPGVIVGISGLEFNCTGMGDFHVVDARPPSPGRAAAPPSSAAS